MTLRLLLIGKTRESWLKEGIAEYLKRLEPMIKLSLEEIPDVSLRVAGTIDKVKNREAEICLKRLSGEDHVILLDEQGGEKTSLEFSGFLSSLSDKKSVVFVIGGVYGSALSLRKRANEVISLSRLTFTHQMARLVLVEQIYRALMITSNRPYHY